MTKEEVFDDIDENPYADRGLWEKEKVFRYEYLNEDESQKDEDIERLFNSSTYTVE